MEGWLSETGLYENPLVPNAKLRQMYVAMVEARLLDEHIAGIQRKMKGRRRLESTRGQEACRVGTAIELGPGDLVSDSQIGVVMELLSGTKIDSLLKLVGEIHSGTKAKRLDPDGPPKRQLPWMEDAGERLRMAMGAALSFRTLGRTNVVVAYVRQGEVAKGEWRRVLRLASKLELPIIFVVLASVAGKQRSRTANLSDKAGRWGVPGMPVDAGDAVALYRVAQESLGRTRGGDGPVFLECVACPAEGKGRGVPLDPLVQMEKFLLSRKVCTKSWLKNAGGRLRRRLATAE